MAEVKVKKLYPLNDYVAIMMMPMVPKGVIIDKATQEKYTNEGIIVGVGPDAGDQVTYGDRILVRQNNYQLVKPENGVFAGKALIFVRKVDLVLKKDPTENEDTYVFE